MRLSKRGREEDVEALDGELAAFLPQPRAPSLMETVFGRQGGSLTDKLRQYQREAEQTEHAVWSLSEQPPGSVFSPLEAAQTAAAPKKRCMGRMASSAPAVPRWDGAPGPYDDDEEEEGDNEGGGGEGEGGQKITKWMPAGDFKFRSSDGRLFLALQAVSLPTRYCAVSYPSNRPRFAPLIPLGHEARGKIEVMGQGRTTFGVEAAILRAGCRPVYRLQITGEAGRVVVRAQHSQPITCVSMALAILLHDTGFPRVDDELASTVFGLCVPVVWQELRMMLLRKYK